VVEVVDHADKIDALMPMLDEMIPEGMVTIERVVILKYLAEPKR
jgi:PII-like signaling protein